jgi:hybrid cluster-associated redox disulfide protein
MLTERKEPPAPRRQIGRGHEEPDMGRPDIDDPGLPLATLLRTWPETARVLLAHRTACVGCPIAPFHTVADACAEYRLDEARLRAALRAATSAIPPPR